MHNIRKYPRAHHRSPHYTTGHTLHIPQVPTLHHRSPHCTTGPPTAPQVPKLHHMSPHYTTGPQTTPQVPTLHHMYRSPLYPTSTYIHITIPILHTTLSHLGTAPIRTSSVFFALLPIIACFMDRTAFNRVSISEESRHERKDWKIS